SGGRNVGKSLESLALHAVGVRVVSMRHASGMPAVLTDDTVLQGGDTLVLSGKAPALALAEDKLLSG
ncbi:MAG: TrkA C-terminal domain-containing protein, partial [Hydrogenophaga sp.]|nr:TrkA C-terminal domain-containing protein [Hydrogenophaga sp.]